MLEKVIEVFDRHVEANHPDLLEEWRAYQDVEGLVTLGDRLFSARLEQAHGSDGAISVFAFPMKISWAALSGAGRYRQEAAEPCLSVVPKEPPPRLADSREARQRISDSLVANASADAATKRRKMGQVVEEVKAQGNETEDKVDRMAQVLRQAGMLGFAGDAEHETGPSDGAEGA